MSEDPALVLGRYRVGGRLAAGAAGTVVAAVDEEDGAEVVVKFFDGSADNFAAWVREVRLAMRLRHPNIARCINAGHDPEWGRPVLVFARAKGGSLRRALAAGRRFDAEAARILLAEVAGALGYAHELGVVHRDVKPENILAAAGLGEPPWLLSDFGAGRFLARGETSRSLAASPAGSLQYMAPEAMSRGASPASDQYSLGIVGVEVVTGELPDRRARAEFRLAHRRAGGLLGLLARLIEPDPSRRFPAMEVAAAALRGPDAGFDVTGTQDGCHLARVGVDLFARRGGVAALERVGRATGARGFVNVWGDAVALLAAEDRLYALSPFPRPVAAAPPERTFVADLAAGLVWSLEEAALCVRSFAGASARVEFSAPAGWQGAPLVGAVLSPASAVLGAVGDPNLAWVEGPGQARRVALRPGPGPLRDIRRLGRATLALFGDAATSIVALCGDGGLRELYRGEVAADELALSLRGGGLVIDTMAPGGAAAVEDDE